MVLNPIRGDAAQYYTYAWNLANHGVFAMDVAGSNTLHPDNYRDPGYPIFLAVCMKLFGTGETWYAIVLLCQALLGALTVVMTMQLGKHWLPTGWVITSGLLMTVWPHSITISGYLLTETLFGFLCALGLLLLARSCARNSTWLAGIAGLVLGAAALTNAVLLPFGTLLAGWLAWRKLAPGKLCLALALGALLLPGTWAIRNAQITHPATVNDSSTARAKQNFVQGAWPSYHDEYRDFIFGDGATRARARNTLHAVDEEYALLRDAPILGIKAIMRRFSQHPWRYVVWYLIEKPKELWGWSIVVGQGDIYVYPTANSPFQTSLPWVALAAVCHTLNLPLMILALIGSLIAWRYYHALPLTNPTGQAMLIATTCLLIFITLVYAALQAEPRYSIPFRSFELLLAASACWRIATRIQQLTQRPQRTLRPAPRPSQM